MSDFPGFMKRARNRIGATEQNTDDIEGYFYEAADGSQMAFWTCRADRVSKPHRHDFDEYMVVVSGRYVAILDGKEHVLGPGDELFIPRGTEQSGGCAAGTRTIHAFGGRRVRGGAAPEPVEERGPGGR
ncbi:MAG: cupin domain-containing protein [Deltaproteobacteria bacterium]|nr:cupin domain-containing protein [Deltaproteobacteria bacterium]